MRSKEPRRARLSSAQAGTGKVYDEYGKLMVELVRSTVARLGRSRLGRRPSTRASTDSLLCMALF